MAMVKLLYENLELSSIEIKENLKLSWNDFTTHSLSLKKNGYVRIEDGFIDGSKRQMLAIEQKGLDEFRELKDLLKLFIQDSTKLIMYPNDLNGN